MCELRDTLYVENVTGYKVVLVDGDKIRSVFTNIILKPGKVSKIRSRLNLIKSHSKFSPKKIQLDIRIDKLFRNNGFDDVAYYKSDYDGYSGLFVNYEHCKDFAKFILHKYRKPCKIAKIIGSGVIKSGIFNFDTFNFDVVCVSHIDSIELVNN